MRRLIRDLALPLMAVLGGCQDLWSSTLRDNPRNCSQNPGQCAADEVCNAVTEVCEPALVLDAVSPAAGPSSGGVSLQLSGRGFLAGTTVSLGSAGLPADPIVIDSEVSLQAGLPASPGSCGPVSITLFRPGGIAVRRDGLFAYFLDQIGFESGQSLGTSTSASTTYLAAQDLDHDGHLDIVATAFGAGGVDILMGHGDGSFQTQPRIPTGAGPYHVAIADVDRNGIPDLAITNVYGSTVSVLIGTGGGQFGSPTNLANTGAFTSQFLDMDQDGLLDLAVLTNTAKLRLWKGDGSGGFNFLSEADIDAGAGLSTMADIDADGLADLLVTAKSTTALAVHRNQGDGTFKLVSLNPLNSPATSCVAVDVNHDGKLDLVAVEYYAGLTSVMLGHGDGMFDAKRGYSTMPGNRVVAAADLNCDGNVDLAVSHNGSPQVTLLRGHGDGTFELLANSASLSSGTSTFAVTIGDVDEDGRPDLLIGADGTAPSVQAALNTSQ